MKTNKPEKIVRYFLSPKKIVTKYDSQKYRKMYSDLYNTFKYIFPSDALESVTTNQVTLRIEILPYTDTDEFINELTVWLRFYKPYSYDGEQYIPVWYFTMKEISGQRKYVVKDWSSHIELWDISRDIPGKMTFTNWAKCIEYCKNNNC